MTITIQEKLADVSTKPGVYLMKDRENTVIYVGKATNLKRRVSSYFIKKGSAKHEQMDVKTEALVKKISSFETVITGTEKEALILESNFIKRYKPRYNIILKDDKHYPSLRLDAKSSSYPNLKIVRKVENDKALYFGPFSSSTSVRNTLKIIDKTFKLRKCKSNKVQNRVRPCLNYQMGTCFAPCCFDVDKDIYNKIVKEVVLFLKGRTPDLIRSIRKDMETAAKMLDFESAKTLRDKMFALERTLEKQVVVSCDFKDKDVIGVARTSNYSLIMLLFIRSGYLVGTRQFHFTQILSDNNEMIGTFIKQYYEKATIIPNEIIVPHTPCDALLLEEWLKKNKEKKVSIVMPVRGEKVRLINMAEQNAKNCLKAFMNSLESDMDILTRLQKSLKMSKIPLRVECFDNSTISGIEPVGCMVVFEKGKPLKSAYRKYKISKGTEQNDYAYMAEVLSRRFKNGDKSKPLPDLLMVDGGKGQLNIAASVIGKLNLDEKIELIGIAKKDRLKGENEDKIFKLGRANPVNLGKDKKSLFFLQRVRDETHRFALSFHQKRRNKKSMESILDTVPGIGEKRKKTLLRHFKSVARIKSASVKEISTLPGISCKAASEIHEKILSANTKDNK